MEEKIKEKYLPLGTVVKLIGGDTLLMITGYCMESKNKITNPKGVIENPDNIYFDYCGCAYPAGIVNTELNILFNHENIEKVLFTGYETELQEKYSKFLKEEMEKLDKKENK